MYPDPDGKVWFRPVKELLHPFHHMLRDTLETGMLEPVLGSVFRKRKVRQNISGDVFV
jgi:hypothetical protein